MYIYIYICKYICMYIYIYVYIVIICIWNNEKEHGNYHSIVGIMLGNYNSWWVGRESGNTLYMDYTGPLVCSN